MKISSSSILVSQPHPYPSHAPRLFNLSPEASTLDLKKPLHHMQIVHVSCTVARRNYFHNSIHLAIVTKIHTLEESLAAKYNTLHIEKMTIGHLYYFTLAIITTTFCCLSHYSNWPEKGWGPHKQFKNKFRTSSKKHQGEPQYKSSASGREKREHGREKRRDRRHQNERREQSSEWIADWSKTPRHHRGPQPVTDPAPRERSRKPYPQTEQPDHKPAGKSYDNFVTGYVPYSHIYGDRPVKPATAADKHVSASVHSPRDGQARRPSILKQPTSTQNPAVDQGTESNVTSRSYHATARSPHSSERSPGANGSARSRSQHGGRGRYIE